MTPTILRTATCDRLRTIGVTEEHPDPTFTVLDSRTTALDPKELPALVVLTTPARVETASLGNGRWIRNQTLVVIGEFEAASDEALALLADTVELAVWGVLMSHNEWVRSWDHLSGWAVEAGRDATADRRRGVVKITITGDYAQCAPDPDDLTPLREIRAQAGLDGTVHDDDPETHVRCDGADDEV